MALSWKLKLSLAAIDPGCLSAEIRPYLNFLNLEFHERNKLPKDSMARKSASLDLLTVLKKGFFQSRYKMVGISPIQPGTCPLERFREKRQYDSSRRRRLLMPSSEQARKKI